MTLLHSQKVVMLDPKSCEYFW